MVRTLSLMVIILLGFVLSATSPAAAIEQYSKMETEVGPIKFMPTTAYLDEYDIKLATMFIKYMDTGETWRGRVVAQRIYTVDGNIYRGLGVNLDGTVNGSPPLWKIVLNEKGYYLKNPEILLRHLRNPHQYFHHYNQRARYVSTTPGTIGVNPSIELPIGTNYSSYATVDGTIIYVVDGKEYIKVHLAQQGDVWVARANLTGPVRT